METQQKIIIIDFMRTLYDPETEALFADSLSVLESLQSTDRALILLSREEGQRRSLMTELGLEPYFTEIILTKDKRSAMREIVDRRHSEQIVVIGDRIRGEIAFGNEYGAKTIWIKKGKFADELPRSEGEKPDHTVTAFADSVELV